MSAVRRVTACLTLAVLVGCAPAAGPEGEDRAGERGVVDDDSIDAGPTTDPDDGSGTGPDGPDGPAGSTGAASADEVRERGEALDLGGPVIHALAEGGTLTVTRPDAHSARLVVSPDGTASPVLLLAVPAGSAATTFEDGSLSLSADVATAGASSTQAPAVGVAPTDGSMAEATDGDVVRLSPRVASAEPDDSTGRPGEVVEAWIGGTAVLSTDWADRTASEGGLSIAVEPAAWARGGGLAGTAAVWSHLERHEPDATGPGMRDQLVCHAVGAPDKATWNLEPWRPDVGLLRTMAARCNPT